LLVFRDSRPVESYATVEKVKYLNHFLAVACSAALSKQRMVAIGYKRIVEINAFLHMH